MKHGGIFDPDGIKKEIKKLEEKSYDENFWNDRKEAEKVLTEIKRKKESYEPWEELFNSVSDTKELLELALEEGDESQENDIKSSCEDIEKKFSDMKTLQLLSGEMDHASAFMTIHSGAGGTEACDWVRMLYRMYTRWAERKDIKVEVIDLLEAEGGDKICHYSDDWKLCPRISSVRIRYTPLGKDFPF